MKAIVTTKSGGSDVLALQDVPAPQPKAGEVLVNIEAVGLNFADVMSTFGRYPGGPKPPFVGGREFAGRIAGTGERVMGYAQAGAFAQQIATSRHALWQVPNGWTTGEAAAFPVNYFTAYLAYWKAGLLPGNKPSQIEGAYGRPTGRRPRVLIHAVAGGVGTAAVQLGKILDIEIFGTSSSDEKLARAKGLGLDHSINYASTDYEQIILSETSGEGVDAVLEMLGGEHTAKSIRCLAFLGRCILYGTVTGKRPEVDFGALYSKSASVHGLWLSVLSSNSEVMTQAYERLSEWIVADKFRPVVGHKLPLERLPDAYALLKERKNFGKVVLTIDQSFQNATSVVP